MVKKIKEVLDKRTDHTLIECRVGIQWTLSRWILHEKDRNPADLYSRENNNIRKRRTEKRWLKPLLDKGLRRYWSIKKRLYHYWIQPELVFKQTLD